MRISRLFQFDFHKRTPAANKAADVRFYFIYSFRCPMFALIPLRDGCRQRSLLEGKDSRSPQRQPAAD